MLLGGFVLLLYYVTDIITFDVVFAEDNNKKSYEQLQQELNMYKNKEMLEIGFRTIDIIFG